MITTTGTTPPAPNANKLAKRLWVIISRAAASPEDVAKHRNAHLEHQVRLEKAGILFGAGPLSDAQGERAGIGLIIIRADTAEEARRIADSDPMHTSGVRTYTLYQWSLNEGRLNVSIDFSDRSYRLD